MVTAHGARLLAGCILGVVLVGGSPAAAQEGASADGEWPTYGGDLGNTKYSPLDQIDRDNFGNLEIAWRWRSADGFLSKSDAAGGELWTDSRFIFAELDREDPNRWRDREPPYLANFKATPLMVGGRLYVNLPTSVGAAIDARTGETIWVYNPKTYEAGTTTMTARWNQRGVAYWTDGSDERILWGTSNGYLVAVDAQTGRPAADFGDGGRVDLMEGLPQAERGSRDWLNALKYSVQSPPIVVGDTVVTPASISSYNIDKEQIPGWTRGWDVRTGRRKWTFETVPQGDSYGNDTWEGDSWRYTGKISGWSIYSADKELGYLYIPLNTAAPDYWGGHRLGDNLYAETLLCLDMETGERVWHYQVVHHGLWDYDLPAAPNLLDIVVDGRPVKAVAQITKQGFVFAFDRVTGEPIWPIEERPVPPSTIPGERASATQPFPTRPAPIEYQGVTVDDLVDFTPEIRRMAMEVIEPFTIGPLYTPPSLVVDGGNQGTLGRPAAAGGPNLGRGGGRPGDGYAVRAVQQHVLRVPRAGAAGARAGYAPLLSGSRRGVSDDAARPAATQAAVLADDRHRHEYGGARLDAAARQRRPDPQPSDAQGSGSSTPGGRQRAERAAADEDAAHQRAVGRRSNDGPRLVARDKATGEEIASVDLPRGAIGTPMTYMLDGKQYVALTVGGSPVPELIALALP